MTLVDPNPARAAVAEALGAAYAWPEQAPRGSTWSSTPARRRPGLQLSLDLLRPDATVIDLSWYGDRPVTVDLGAAFHARRLTVRGSQVGTIAAPRRSSRNTQDRLSLALDLLRDNAFDALLTGASPFGDLPATMAGIETMDGLCHTIYYEGE